jgi:hypothetical protein
MHAVEFSNPASEASFAARPFKCALDYLGNIIPTDCS